MRILFLLIPLLLVAYVMMRIWYILPFTGVIKTAVVCLGVAIFVAMFVSLLAGLEKMPLNLASVVYETTTSWLIILLYLLMIFLCMDLLRICRIMPKEWLFSSVKGCGIVCLLTFGIFLYGNIHYYHKYRQTLSIKTEKKLDKPVKIVMISDLHIGYHNRRSTLKKWVDMINKENADMILIAGDIIDISTYPVNKERSFEEFRRLNAPVYACLGNHEYLAGIDKVKEFYSNAGINLLIDSCCVHNDEILVIGRDDRSNQNRKSIARITQNADKSKYSILIDHQPYNLEQAQNNNIDFQFSGHTHDGQIFPGNLIVKAIYENGFGYCKKGHTDYYVTSGLGIWGGKFRIGTRSEYVVMQLSN